MYRTTKHVTTGLSPYKIPFGSNPPPLHLPTAGNITHQDPADYSNHLQGKLLELRELVEANVVESADRQQQNYHSGKSLKLRVGQEVLPDNPTKGKLDPHWTGP